jgi:hypothetical protein
MPIPLFPLALPPALPLPYTAELPLYFRQR